MSGFSLSRDQASSESETVALSWPKKLFAPFARVAVPHQPLFASISAALSPSIVEPKTGIALPEEVCFRGSRVQPRCSQLTGMGVRVKKIGVLGVKVYAVGVYVDKPAIRKCVGAKVYNKPTPALYKDVIWSDEVEKTISLTFARNVKGESIKQAFQDQLEPKLGNSGALAKFQSAFDDVELKKGQTVKFNFSRGAVSTHIDDKQLNSLTSPALSHALLETYLGPDPVAPDAKDSFGAGLVQYLNTPKYNFTRH